MSPSLVLQAVHNRRVRAPEGQSVWRNHDFRRVLVGSTVNDIGDWMLTLALPIYVFTTTGSGRNTAVVFLIELIISVVLGPLGGAVADRWDLRLTIVSTNVAQAVALLPLLAATGSPVSDTNRHSKSAADAPCCRRRCEFATCRMSAKPPRLEA